MAKRQDLAAADTGDTAQPGKKRRHWAWRLLRTTFIFVMALMVLRLLVAQLYHGPRDKAAVVAAMPGVPLFPLSEMSPSNLRAQRALAIPLWFMRFQGAKRAEAAQLQAPADTEFIIEWYRHIAPTQGWDYIGRGNVASGTRLIFVRGDEGLQLTLGDTRDSIVTPLQLIYLQGMSARQKEQLTLAVPRDTSQLPLKATAPVKPPKPDVTPEQAAKQTGTTAASPAKRTSKATRQTRATRTETRRRTTKRSTGTVARQRDSKPRRTTATRTPASTTTKREGTTRKNAERKATPKPTYTKPAATKSAKNSPSATTKKKPAAPSNTP